MDNRKRVNSSMTYLEYVDTFEQAPRKPSLKPQDGPIDIPDLSLDSEETGSYDMLKVSDRIEHSYRPSNVIMEENDDVTTVIDNQLNIFECSDKKAGRMRSQSENIQYTFISFMERKSSIKLN